MRLKYQIFLTLLAGSALLIAIMFVLSSWSFSRGFLEYVNENEKERLSPVAEELVYRYEESGSWDSIDLSDLRRFQSPRERRQSPRANRESSNNDRRGNAANRPLDGASRPARRRDARLRPLVLADESKNVIAGPASQNSATLWIALRSNDQIVGFLGYPETRRVDRQFDQAFEKKQRKNLTWAALALIAFSALLSIPLAGLIVRPLLKVNNAVDEISSGNYAHRVKNNRRDELGDLANNINTLGLSLEQNRDARQRWIAEISHELRTPVAVMRGELEAVQDGVREMDKPAIDSLHAEALNLGRLIDDLHTLSISDVGALDYQMAPLRLNVFVSDFLASSETMLVQNKLSFTNTLSKKPMHIQGDAQRLEQLLANLLQNTVRYTDAPGQLQVGLSQTSVEGKPVWVLDWFDSGPGVDALALPKLFDPLYRTEESRSREHGGSGLGLSIAKRIVEAHHGRIEAKESKLGGLHLSISFPASANNV